MERYYGYSIKEAIIIEGIDGSNYTMTVYNVDGTTEIHCVGADYVGCLLAISYIKPFELED